MAENQTTAPPEAEQEVDPTAGRVTRVQGSVIDVEFPVGYLPDIYNALKVDINTVGNTEGDTVHEITLEVEQHLGDSTVRAVALKPTDGLVRGALVRDTGVPISVPVGDVTKGHVFDVTGNILNAKPGEHIEVTERYQFTVTHLLLISLSLRLRCSKLVLRLSICLPLTFRAVKLVCSVVQALVKLC